MTPTRTFVSLATLAAVIAGGLSATSARAADGDDGSWVVIPERPSLPALDYDPRPGILFVPFEEVTLTAPPNCKDGTTQANSAKDCSSVVSAETTFPAWGDATAQMDLMMGLQAALDPYNVNITNTRPDPYVPYHMLIMSDNDEPMSEATVCGFAGIGCDGVPRNQVALVVGSTMNCMDRDPLATALYLFGRLSGLEPTTETADPMGRPLDPMNPATSYMDACNSFETPDMLQCVSTIHKSYCNDMDGVQNSHQELLGVYGPRPANPDGTPPTIDSIMPADGSTITATEDWTVTATASDDSGYYVAIWETLEVPAAAMGAVPDCGSTNRACPVEFMNDHATKDLPWDFFSAPAGQAPAGTYRFRFTAQDMYGNKTSQEISFTVEGDAGGSSGGNSSGGSTSTSGGSTSGGGSTGGIESGGGADGGSSDGGGCSCRAASDGQGALGALALLALGAIRRRR